MKFGFLVGYRIVNKISKNQPDPIKTVVSRVLRIYPTLAKKRVFWSYSKLRSFAAIYDLSGRLYGKNWSYKHIPLRHRKS